MQTRITNQRDLRREFWATFPELSRKRSRIFTGPMQNAYCADTRMAFVDWLDGLQKGGQISGKLAERATL